MELRRFALWRQINSWQSRCNQWIVENHQFGIPNCPMLLDYMFYACYKETFHYALVNGCTAPGADTWEEQIDIGSITTILVSQPDPL